jgi:NADH-quinone oxidoreductase subunit M
MFAAFDNFPALLIWLPLLGGVLSFFMKSEKAAKGTAMFFSILTLGVIVTNLFYTDVKYQLLNQVSYVWLPGIGASFALILDGLTRTLTLLTAIVVPIAILNVPAGKYKSPNVFFGLLMLTFCGLMGVFMAIDALVFYLFWELALIPVYFLSSIYGGEKRIKATFKFFIYTFVGSLFLLIGIFYIYLKTSGSFSLVSFYNATPTNAEQSWVFFLFLIAFAIKMPIFPFHTWQPDAYEQAPTPVTMILSGVMVKMGLFGVIRWLLPMFPFAAKIYAEPMTILIVIGMIYASFIAIKQDSVKRLIAYSSIAHIGLMAAGLFTLKAVAINGVFIQMFNHGINIVGLWLIADIIERQTGVSKISELGGVARKAPILAIFMVVIAFANIALPMTNAFIGEFMVFNGLFQMKPWIAALAGVSIILSAIYTLNMVKNVFYGEVSVAVSSFNEINALQIGMLTIITLLIFILGLYPTPYFQMITETVGLILNKFGTI